MRWNHCTSCNIYCIVCHNIFTTGKDFPWDYHIIPVIPKLSPELTKTFPVYTHTSPDGNPWMPGLFPDMHWGIPSLPWLPPEIPWETHVGPLGHPDILWRSPLMARTTPWYSLTVTWWSYIPNDIPCWYGNFFLKKIFKKLKFCL